jgi:signal transduction histidine kinase
MKIFLMPYGRELYSRRPISELMNRRPLVLRAGTAMDEAARAIAAEIRSPITEDFVVADRDGKYLGMGAVLDVLHAVEDGLTRRTTQLEEAHAKLRASQLQLIQSEKMASLGQMVAGLVHEINTPLGYVQNNVEMTRSLMGDATQLIEAQSDLLKELGETVPVNDALYPRMTHAADLRKRVDAESLQDMDALLGDTLHGLRQIGELIGNLKDFSRLDQADRQAADLNKLVAGALRIVEHMARKKNVTISHHAGELPPIHCAPAQINQVLLNLLSNAIQAIEQAQGQVVVRTQALDGRVLFLVEDNGKGIAAENLQRIFDPFFTTKPIGQGTGLGLAIAHQIIESHGGAVRVTSRPGAGTRFLVSLPTRPDKVSP